ncbi:MAG: AAA family ATPase [Candidatus Limiplasma sp.]|nr:AAA family ATPase [Candidatus Limiplasma sp.]
MKINRLEIENVKRVKAVTIEPAANGLTVIGGKNGQGKTSVLDALAWALGGDKYRPSEAQREGSTLPPNIHIVMSNGLVVERKGKNSDLKVIDPSGKRSGQTLLDGFVEQLALDLPRFMQATSKEKAETLLKIIGVGDRLKELDRQETDIYNRRTAIGQIADQKEKYAKEQVYYPDTPREPVSASDLIRQQQDILARNGENQRKRQNLAYLESEAAKLAQQMNEIQDKIMANIADLEIARKSALDLHDESTAELEANINQIDETNRKVRANLDKFKAEEDAQGYRDQYTRLTGELDGVRKAKTDLLAGAPLPLPELSVQDGELLYQGHKWDGISSSDQLRVATAIVRKLNPQCEFVLLDKLEQMDLDTLREFSAWLEAEGLQAIATRVSTGGECSIIISDGYVEGDPALLMADASGGQDAEMPVLMPATPTFREGEF